MFTSVVAACTGSEPPVVSPPRDAGSQARDGGARDAGPRDSGASLRDGGAEERDAGEFDGVLVTVTLDGVGTEGITVVQGGSERRWTTGPDGRVVIELDPDVVGQPGIAAVHPEARTGGAEIFPNTTEVTIDLVRFDDSDNPDYAFADPGEPGRRGAADVCAHCHVALNEDWHDSPHRTSAANTTVHDLYAGAAAAFDSAAACTTAGGVWLQGIEPGTGATAMRCYIGDGALEAVNAACNAPPCEPTATEFAACADCHAPAIDGALGGRNLLDAQGVAFDFGVSCDACHRVERVDLAAEPGVAGRLRLLRPSEPGSPTLGAGGLLPITFGPSFDSPNPRMGSVQRDHFRDATICAGCHQHESAPMRVGDTIDTGRWPSGRLPIQTTYAEWLEGPMNPTTPCQECHMPPRAEQMNAANLQDTQVFGVAGGWQRAPGAVRNHGALGPRTAEARMLSLAASVFVDKSVDAGTLVATVRVKNTGAGHAIPTGEPMRSIVLSVEARCNGTPLVATGGDAVPDFGGALAVKTAQQDWNDWPDAQVGDVVRVVARPGGHHDYQGPLTFGDGSRTPVERGMPVETVVGEATIANVAGSNVTFATPLPAGDVAYLVRGAAVPTQGSDAALLAGASGFAFARVLVDANGARQVPHFTAVDVASDNRLPPQSSFTTTHRFSSPCSDPVVTARLSYRSYPARLADERGWTNIDRVMAEVTR